MHGCGTNHVIQFNRVLVVFKCGLATCTCHSLYPANCAMYAKKTQVICTGHKNTLLCICKLQQWSLRLLVRQEMSGVKSTPIYLYGFSNAVDYNKLSPFNTHLHGLVI